MRIYRSEHLIGTEKTVHIFTSTEKGGIEAHTHDFIEIIYMLSGHAEQYVNDEVYHVSRGDLLFLNYGATHRFSSEAPFSYVNICFDPAVLAGAIITPENAFAVLQLTAFAEIRMESDNGVVSFGVSEREEIEFLLSSMQREYERKTAGWNTVLESYMNVLLIHILRKLTVVSSTETRRDDEMWRALSDYIDRNLGAELSLSALAGKCFYNPSYFSRVFKERFGMSLTEYVSRRKIEQIISLARDQSLSVEELAMRAGFSSKSTMYRTFQKVKGISFSEFRKDL